MLPLLVARLLLSAPLLVHAGDRPPRYAEVVRDRGAFLVGVRGVLDSRIAVRFPVALGKRFSARRVSRGGERVEVGGVLRPDGKGGYFLDLKLTEVTPAGRRKRRSFSVNLVAGGKALFCSGWVWWYEVQLTQVK
jgi:hypothetical protein